MLGGLLHVINCNDFPACHEEGESVVYVDDDTDVVHAKSTTQLQAKIEREANNSASWLKDNRLCVAGDKSKLLVIGTKQLKRRIHLNNMSIMVDNKQVSESLCEKLLGVRINNELTWKAHLYGDASTEGLITQLSKRVGILSKLSKHMNKTRIKQFAAGIFYSKLNYCLPVFGHVFGLEKYKESQSRYTSFTTADNHRLQVLQNKINRIITGANNRTSTAELLKMTDSLSFQQMISYQTLVMTQKIIKSGKPTYLARRLYNMPNRTSLRGENRLYQPRFKLSIKSEGFVARGQTLMNALDSNIRNEESLRNFKSKAREWIIQNIAVKPVSRV